MTSGRQSGLLAGSVPIAMALAMGIVWSQEKGRSSAPLALGLDHLPLAVKDLEKAAERYRELGFTLKAGRPHANGIRNLHAKFSDGSEIELITAAEARDALTTEYLGHLAKGDGPAFVSLFAPDMNGVARLLTAAGRPYQRDGGLLSFPATDPLRHIFFGQRTSSPTDRPVHFQHANGAEALIGVWLAGNDLAAELGLLRSLGASIADEHVCVPEGVRATVARLPQGEVVLLGGSRQLVPGRRIVGATVRVPDVKIVQRVLAKGPWKVPPVVQTTRGSSVFLSPDLTHGIWLEFRSRIPRATA